MKINVHIDDQYKETEIHIYAPSYSKEIEKLMKQLQEPTQATMIGYLDQDIHVLKVEDIYAVVTEDARVYLQTEEFEYESKYKLYEIEDKYSTFARINKSTLINIDFLQMIQGKFGKTEAILLNEISFPISRRYLKTLKEKLGIGRENE